MGLAEKRILQQFKENNFLTFKNELKSIFGKDIPLEVSWDIILAKIDGRGEEVIGCMQQIYFDSLLISFKGICVDQMGKDALTQSLQKIIINAEMGSQAGSSLFEGGVFTLNHEPCSNVDYADQLPAAFTEMLEKGL